MIQKIILLLLLVLTVDAKTLVDDETSLFKTIEEVNTNPTIKTISFKKNVKIELHRPIIYFGKQTLTLFANDATLMASQVGRVHVVKGINAQSSDATLLFKTAANITIKNITIKNSATRAIAQEIPKESHKGETKLFLSHVNVIGSALHGIHMDDNFDAFDDGKLGAKRSLKLIMEYCKVLDNGIGASDFDGVRVDERSDGSIDFFMHHSIVKHNGGDGIELDEAGKGDVIASLFDVNISDNGFYNKKDLDDGFDIDEAGKGDVRVSLMQSNIYNNKEEALDFDEKSEGDMIIDLVDVKIWAKKDMALSLREKDEGKLEVSKKSYLHELRP